MMQQSWIGDDLIYVSKAYRSPEARDWVLVFSGRSRDFVLRDFSRRGYS
jgi:hypothetical protein